MDKINLVNNFWYWFKLNSDKIYENENNYIDLIDKEISSFHGISWEIGYVNPDQKYLAISPSLNFELLDDVDLIVSHAPKIDKWHFYKYRQRKVDWLGIIKIIDENNMIKQIDFNNWNCVLYRYDDGIYDVSITKDLELSKHSDYILNNSIQIAFINILGEELYMNKLNDISFDKTNDAKTHISIFSLYNILIKD